MALQCGAETAGVGHSREQTEGNGKVGGHTTAEMTLMLQPLREDSGHSHALCRTAFALPTVNIL